MQTNFSPAQLAWLESALKETAKLKHTFVFLHHPRWVAETYPGAKWDQVHSLLKTSGNVRAVFAGHVHRLRFDGDRDGIPNVLLEAMAMGVAVVDRKSTRLNSSH